MISIAQLTKIYPGNIHALRGIDLEIQPGMFGLLGPNGAGKTTLLRILAGLIQPSSGQVRIFGRELTGAGKRAIQERLGYLPQDFRCYPQLSAREFLDYIAILKGLTETRSRRFQVEEALERVRLQDTGKQPLRSFSGGMLRRVGIAQALLGQPQLLIVDEPTVGLDPEERIHIRNLLSEYASNAIVLLSTHIVEDIGYSCADMAVIQQGCVLFHGHPTALADRAQGQVWLITTAGEAPEGELQIISTRQLRTHTQYRAVGKPNASYHASPAEPSLEDGYIVLMRKVQESST